MRKSVLVLVVPLVVTVAVVSAAYSGEPSQATDARLEQAIVGMRKINPKLVKPTEREAKAKALQADFEAVKAAGSRGADRLIAELDLLSKNKEADDFFALGACILLWEIRKADAADRIAGIWRSADLTTNYNYVFGTAFSAARTRDVRVLPMLRALLGDKKGRFVVPMHSLTLEWPENQRFLWGVFGPSALPVLHKALGELQSPEELETAMLMLTDMQYLPALPDMRRLSSHKNGLVRAMALESLGLFGHPDDWDTISRGLNSADPQEYEWYAIAARNFLDLRAVPLLIPHLSSKNERERGVTVWALTELPSPAAMDALDRYAAKTTQEEERKYLQQVLDGFVIEMGCTREQYGKKTEEDKGKAFAVLYAGRRAALALKADDRKFTHEEFLAAAQEWKKNHRIGEGIKDRHILAVATAEDIPLLLDIAASVRERLSDECMYEIGTLSRVLARVGRSRYRKEPGLAAKVEPVP